MKIVINDRNGYVISSREVTDNGYLKVPGKVARIGVQRYLAKELGLTDRAPNSIVSVYRPPEAVFDQASLASYDNADITNNHPSDMVDAASYKEVAAGHAISAGRQDGEFVIVDLLIKDKDLIDAIQNTDKVELSVGYTAEYTKDSGITPDGEIYEFIQRDIRVNHIALVDHARAGRQARLFDETKEPREAVNMKRITLDNGVVVDVADDAAAVTIQSAFDGLRARLKDAEEKAEKAEAKSDKKDEEIEEERKKSNDAAISARVASALSTLAVARKIAGSDFTCDSVDAPTIQRAALTKVRSTVDWAAKSDAYVQAAWDMESEKDDDDDEDDKDGKEKETKDSHAQFGRDMKTVKTVDAQAAREDAYEKFCNTRFGKK